MSLAPVRLTAEEYREVADLARRQFGLELGEGKREMVASRLAKQMRELNFPTFREYRAHVANDRTGEALTALIDALTTNHTNFFREPAHFDFLRQTIVPEFASRGPLRVWCAASSTGEEPYSIALTLREAMGTEARAKIVATDISTRVLAIAERGMYRAERFGGEPDPWLKRYLQRGQGQAEGWYRMRPEVRAMIEFSRLNLIERLPDLGRFAAIFCRNVMIYFSRETQELVVRQLTECLEPGGYLLVGHSESLTGVRHSLEPVRPAVYRKPGRRT
ncbi:MAG: protein-glutamate O-methyltransferase CheR [Bryobacteraceae bacterium]|nr:protein-glutamate O-methyltransferase CheR [Bryobacteraceae bacterium]